MAIFLVELPDSSPGTRRASKMLVSANAAADAKTIAAAKFGGDAGDAAWTAATVTQLADVASNADDALVGWRFAVSVRTPAGAELVRVDFTGVAADDTIDTIAAELVTLLNADANIAGAAYNSTSQALTVAVGSGGDDLGDHTVVCTILPPIETNAQSEQTNADVDQSGAFVSSITHEGVATDDLTITFNADTVIRPTVLHTFL